MALLSMTRMHGRYRCAGLIVTRCCCCEHHSKCKLYPLLLGRADHSATATDRHYPVQRHSDHTYYYCAIARSVGASWPTTHQHETQLLARQSVQQPMGLRAWSVAWPPQGGETVLQWCRACSLVLPALSASLLPRHAPLQWSSCRPLALCSFSAACIATSPP